MAFARWLTASRVKTAVLALAATALVGRDARADAALAPGSTGLLGAVLLAGPLATAAGKRPSLRADFELPPAVSADGRGARLGEQIGDRRLGVGAWQVASAASGAIDVRGALKTQGAEATALAFGVLRVTTHLRGFLLLGVDDGVAVYLDGKRVLDRDEGRAAGDDDDVIPVDLAPGDHPLLLKLHQRGGAWTIRLRLTDPALAAARGVSWVLPGDIDATRLAESMLDLSLDRGLTGAGLAPRLKVEAHGGLPRGVARGLAASARGKAGALFDVAAGDLPMEDDGPVFPATVALPPLDAADLGDDGEVSFEAHAGPLKKTFSVSARKALRDVIARSDRLRPGVEARPEFLRDPDATLATLDALGQRVARFVARGDADVASQLDEASAFDAFLDAIEKKTDPFLAIRGARRVAYRSPLDGKPSTFGLYIPPKAVLDGSKRYPLVVALHGMNGKPINMMRWVFGRDDPNHDGEWEDRHPGQLPDSDVIVVTPMAHFNSMYRYVGEEDVVAVMEWAKKMLPVDAERVSITGPSMGGTGTAWVAFRHADRFAAAAPLCGYHSYFIRGDMAGKPRRPWETLQAEERSTISWAANGLHLPLMIVHGTRDLPVENSGVLIDRYKSLGYSLVEEHPDEGHNVWQPTYEDLKGMRWLTSFKRPAHPSRVVLRTSNLRYDRHAWLRVARLERSGYWGEVRGFQGKKRGKNVVELKTSGVAALVVEPDAKLLDAASPVSIVIDGDKLEAEAGQKIELERREGAWHRGLSKVEGLAKRAHLSGPIRDVYHEPLRVFYGTTDPLLTRANEQVARWFASIRGGFEIDYPVLPDTAFEPSMAASGAIVLVGGPQSNAITRALDDRLPIHVTSSPPEVRAAAQRFSGNELGAAFVYPNPDHPGRLVVVIAGADVPGTLRATSLPDFLPDFAVYDARVAPSRGQFVLNRGSLLAGGLFDERWQLPAKLGDPLAP